ncbi:RNA-binding S4 domain-containing protein [Terracidiphilus gabretensis]|jgi:ribosome-associated heat shock protein Hsp15|uniref:RNA-binding S4 domain-containing protein n=1 Tax=Terracidiphilus gabretensis TaxID=1577687 RepID=UPI00071B20AB|nr:S4 domain-containing protein [Terracidiphilus gabretensis]
MSQSSHIRIDKWLWAARFFKTRALAVKACDLGRIRINHLEVKPAREVRVGDMVWVRNEGGEFEIEVLAVSEVRGPASVAQGLFRETDASKERRAQEAEARRAMQAMMPMPEHRPSKKDRRLIHKFRQGME